MKFEAQDSLKSSFTSFSDSVGWPSMTILFVNPIYCKSNYDSWEFNVKVGFGPQQDLIDFVVGVKDSLHQNKGL